MTDEEKAIKAMKIRENFMTTNRSGASTLNGRRPESEQRLNVSRPSHGRKLGLLRLWLHGVSRRAHSALCKNFIYSKYHFGFLTGGRSREHSRLAKASVENIILLYYYYQHQ